MGYEAAGSIMTKSGEQLCGFAFRRCLETPPGAERKEKDRQFTPEGLETWTIGKLLEGSLMRTLQTHWFQGKGGRFENGCFQEAGFAIEKSGEEACRNIKTSGEAMVEAIKDVVAKLEGIGIYLDGRRVAEGLVPHLAREAIRNIGTGNPTTSWAPPLTANNW
jgi:hypothetical protein